MAEIKDLSSLTVEQVLKVVSIFSERSLDAILDKSVEIIPTVFKWKGCSIFLYDEDDDIIKLVRTSGLTADVSEEIIYERNEGLTGWVFDAKKPLLITDLDKKTAEDLQKHHPKLKWLGKFSESDRKKAKSFMAVPLISQTGNFYGVIRTASNTINFSQSDLEIFTIIASYVAMAIDNSEYLRREKRKTEYLELLMKVGTEMLSFFELSDHLAFVAENTAKTISSETCEIYLRSKEDKNRLVLKAGYGIPRELINVAEHQVGEGLTGTIVKEDRTIRSKNVLLLPEYKGKYRNAIKDHLKFGDRLTFLGMPIKIKNEIIGAIKLYNIIAGPERENHFTEDDEKYLKILVDMISVAIENVQYFESMKYSAVKTMKQQRLTALGTLAMRIPSDLANPLTEARLSIRNFQRKIASHKLEPAEDTLKRFESIQNNLKKVADGVRMLQEFSTRAGFLRVKRTWSELLDESLLFLTHDILAKKIEVRRNKDEEAKVPQMTVDPSESIEVLVTLISMTIYRFRHYGSLLNIETRITDERILITNILGSDNLEGVEIARESMEDRLVESKSYSPYQFSLDVVTEIVNTNYHGNISFNESAGYAKVVLEIPIG